MTMLETINQDCEFWENIVNKDAMIEQDLKLAETDNSEQSGLYQLFLNDAELWYGTLAEINAVVKTMIARIVWADRFEPV